MFGGGSVIGLSVSFCVADIIEGRVKLEDVEKIVSGMKCGTLQDFRDVCVDYRALYWAKDPDRGVFIARQLWVSGRIEQPRLKGGKPPALGATGNWVASESDIRWMDDFRERGY